MLQELSRKVGLCSPCLAQQRLLLHYFHVFIVIAAAEGKFTDDGSGGGNGTAYGILAATSLAVAAALAIAPHTVSFKCPHPLLVHVHKQAPPHSHCCPSK